LASLSNVNQGVAERSFSEPGGNSLWEMVLHAGSLGTQIEASVGAQEPAFIAKYAFQLAQAFNLFYHHHRVLTEEDQAKKMFFLQLSHLVELQLVSALELLGIESPEKNVDGTTDEH